MMNANNVTEPYTSLVGWLSNRFVYGCRGRTEWGIELFQEKDRTMRPGTWAWA